MRFTKRLTSILLTVSVINLAFLAAGCKKSGPVEQAGAPSGTGAPQESKAKTTYTIGMSQCNLGEPWRVK